MNFIQPRIYKLVYVVFMIAGILSCSRGVIDPDLPEDNIPMEFTTSADWGVKSKSLINNSEDLQSYEISILANAEVGENVYSVFDNDRLYFENANWTYGAAKYWIPGAKYSFAAFAPFASAANTNKLSNGTVSFSDTDGNPVLTITDYDTGSSSASKARTEDLLVAHYERDNTSSKDYSVVPLDFEHILSCITFNIRNTTNNDITKVRDIKLNGLQYKCDINITTSEVSVTAKEDKGIITSADRVTEAGGTPFLPKGMSESDYKTLFDCGELTLLPQSLYGQDDMKLTFKVHYGDKDDDGTGYSLSLGNIEAIREWKSGKKYEYNMSITSTDILFQVVEVPWIEHDIEL